MAVTNKLLREGLNMLSRYNSCWCGSGLKYKECHYEFDQRLSELRKKGYIVPSRDIIKNEDDIEGIKKSAEINNGILDIVAEKIKEGMTTEEIDKMAYDYTISKGGIPGPLNYDGFPKSICTSVNDEVCHGIPDKSVVLKAGDIVNVDATTILDGYYSDASRMFIIGEASEKAKRLVEVTRECLRRGVEAVKPWGFLGDVGAVIHEYASQSGYSVVREFGGHGVGFEMHEDPFVPHVGKKGTGMVLVPGMVLTIEPMINEGRYEIYIDEKNGWTAHTLDGKLSAQWEHTILVTETGAEILAW